MEYEVIEMLLSYNRPGTYINPTGIVIHETASPGSTALDLFEYFNSGNRGASAHFFVDDQMIINAIPINERAYHAGATANENFIGIELSHFDNDVERFNEVYQRGVALAADLLLELGIYEVNENNILSHHEVSLRWGETNHVDPDAYFEQYGVDIDTFRSDVQRVLNDRLGI